MTSSRSVYGDVAPRYIHQWSAKFAFDYFDSHGVIVHDPMVYKQHHNALFTFTNGIQAAVVTAQAATLCKSPNNYTEFKIPPRLYKSSFAADYVILSDAASQIAQLVSIQKERIYLFIPCIEDIDTEYRNKNYAVCETVYLPVPIDALQRTGVLLQAKRAASGKKIVR